MTPQEERLVLDLHAKWGNRWSRIARKLPGRTDNEIKNYWRTHMRKTAQEKKRSPAAAAASDTSPTSPVSSSAESLPFPDSTTGVESFYDTGGPQNDDKKPAVPPAPEYSMDDIWKEISLGPTAAAAVEAPVCHDAAAWGQDQLFYCSDSLWKMADDEASDKSFGNGQFLSGFDYYGVSEALTG